MSATLELRRCDDGGLPPNRQWCVVFPLYDSGVYSVQWCANEAEAEVFAVEKGVGSYVCKSADYIPVP